MTDPTPNVTEIMQLATMLSKETKSRIRETLENNLREYVSALVEDRDKWRKLAQSSRIDFAQPWKLIEDRDQAQPIKEKP